MVVKIGLVLLAFGIAFIGSGCSLTSLPLTPEPTAIPRDTNTPTPTITPKPTLTTTFTPTITNTPTLKPTNTPIPTNTPTSTSTPVPTPIVARLGTRLVQGPIALTVNNPYKTRGSPQVGTPQPGNIFVVVQVKLENLALDLLSYAPYNFKLKDSANFEYTTTRSVAQPALLNGRLVRGDQVQGLITFEVAESSRDFLLIYESAISNLPPMRFALGQ